MYKGTIPLVNCRVDLWASDTPFRNGMCIMDELGREFIMFERVGDGTGINTWIVAIRSQIKVTIFSPRVSRLSQPLTIEPA